MSENSLQLLNKTSETSLNQTEMSFSLLLTLSLSSVPICILGLAGNGVVLWFLCFEFKRNPFTVYILNLAAADFMLLLSTIVKVLCILTNPSSPISLINKGFVFYINLFIISGYHGSLLLLTVISVERCLSVMYPLWYKCRRPTHLSTIACLLIWTSSIIIMTIEGFVCNWESEDGTDPRCAPVMIFMVSWTYGIVSPILITSNLLMMIIVKRSSKKRQPMRLYRAILLNVIVFLITTVPPRLVDAIFYFHIHVQNNFQFLSMTYSYIFFTALNSSANPYIYFLVGRTKKRSTQGPIKGALHRVFTSDNDISNPETNQINECRSGDLELTV